MKKSMYGAVGMSIVAILSLGVNYSNPDIYG
ncbi:Phr family secreted Rap phosphatase inhibitor, partial [Bacillus cereus]